MKKQKKIGHAIDKALAKVASVKLPKSKKLQSADPFAEKDEIKQAERQQRKRMKGKNS